MNGMSSATTIPKGPRPITSSGFATADGTTIEEWRRIAADAHADKLANPRDVEAVTQYEIARNVLRQHAEIVAGQMRRATIREGENLAEQTVAERPSALQAYAANALHGGSIGSGDELAGLLAMLPGGQTPTEATQRYRTARDALYEQRPVASFTGDVTGSLALGAGTAAAFPRASAAIVAGGRLPQAVAAGGRVADPLWRSMRAAGAIGAGEGAARGLAGEGGLGERAEDAAVGAVIGLLTSAGLTGLANRLRLRHARRLARDVWLARRTGAGLPRADVPPTTQGGRGLSFREPETALSRPPVPEAPSVNPREAAFREALVKMGLGPEDVERQIARQREAVAMGVGQVAPRSSVVRPPQTVQPQRGATQAQLAYRQARLRGDPVPEPDVIRPPTSTAIGVSSGDADIAELGQALPALIQGPVTPDMMEVTTDAIRRASPAARQALWADVQAQWAGMPDSWRSFLATLLRPAAGP